MSLRTARRLGATLATAAALTAAVASPALAQTPDNHQEYQCSPGILGTGIACTSAPIEDPAPTDVFQGGPLGDDSATADALRTILGGGLLG